MMLKRNSVQASLALCAMIVLSCLFVGCERKEEVYTTDGNAYMKDPVLKQQLAAQDAARTKILCEREKLIARFGELEKMAGSRAAAEKLPEWKLLEQQAQACGRSFESNRQQTTEILRARMQRAKADTERVRRGEAKAITISK